MMTRDLAPSPLEVWAGLECTLNRVGDRQHDQLALAGHYGRLDDLDRLAELGVRTVRYPVLWEHVTGAATPSSGGRMPTRRCAVFASWASSRSSDWYITAAAPCTPTCSTTASPKGSRRSPAPSPRGIRG